MDVTIARQVFDAQAANVRALNKARTQIRRTLNSSLARGDESTLSSYTFFYSLLYSAWAEANFQKLIFTPHSFSVIEIQRIQAKAKSNHGNGWLECLEVGLTKVYGPKNTSFLPNARQRLRRLINQIIVQPYELRNKIAHGQWVTATNSDYSAIHSEITARLTSLDYIQIDRWFEIFSSVSHIVEMLIASPKKGFTNRYWEVVADIENKIIEMSNWSILDRKTALIAKRSSFDVSQARQRVIANWACQKVIPSLRNIGTFQVNENEVLPPAVAELL